MLPDCNKLAEKELIISLTLCVRIHSLEHFKKKYEVDEVFFTDEVCTNYPALMHLSVLSLRGDPGHMWGI